MSASMQTITATVTYRERIALPDDAVVEVRLEDVSRADAAATIVAEGSVRPAGRQVPIVVELRVDAATIDEKARYNLRALISVGDQAIFRSTSAVAVLTHGAGHDAEIVVTRAAEPAASAGVLEGTPWQLASVGEITASSGGRKKPYVEFQADGLRVTGHGGVNGFTGRYSLDGERLTIADVTSTMMAGPPALMNVERGLLDALSATATFEADGGGLRLKDESGTVVATFSASGSP